MSYLMDKSDNELRNMLHSSCQMLTSPFDSLDDRSDMQSALACLMRPDDMLETLSELAVKEPDSMRLTLPASMAAPVNLQSVKATEAKIQKRVGRNQHA
ncbi:MAG: hypothetical protein R3C59_16970 [Planctomycetaceae bacterium]